MTSVNLTAGTLTVVRGYDGTTPSVHAAGAYVVLETPVLPAPSDFKMVLTQSSGNSFQATLYNLDTANTLGQVNFNMPPGVANLALEGGPGNNVIDVESSVTEDVSIFGGPGNNTLMAGSGDDTLVAGSGTGVLYGGSVPTSSTAATCRSRTRRRRWIPPGAGRSSPRIRRTTARRSPAWPRPPG